MNFKNKFFVFFILISIGILTIINIKNPEKTKFYLLTSKTEEISLGNLITITYLTGFTFTALLNILSKNNFKKSLTNEFSHEEEIDKSYMNNLNQEFESIRPPERDIRESQPTISVNYRFVDQDNDTLNAKNSSTSKNDLNSSSNDWSDIDNDW
tara:strand:+ start:115 stop:576 length:462 start_codon:yes stop_codon:yes gene_type:complete